MKFAWHSFADTSPAILKWVSEFSAIEMSWEMNGQYQINGAEPFSQLGPLQRVYILTPMIGNIIRRIQQEVSGRSQVCVMPIKRVPFLKTRQNHFSSKLSRSYITQMMCKANKKSLTDFQLPLDPPFTPFPEVNLCLVVFSHHLHKFSGKNWMLVDKKNKLCFSDPGFHSIS